MIECMRTEARNLRFTEQRWISVSERLPNEDEFIKSYRRNKYAAEFIVMIKGANRPTTLYFTHDGWWTDNMKDRYDVTAWMPLPEPYRESEDNMERLTYVAENGEVLFHPADLPDDEGITITQLAKDGRYKALEEIAERLANREQAEEQGLLLRLPCKVGSNIYRITDDGVEVAVCREMTVADKEMYIESVTLCDWISFDEIGKSVFLTREEAEAKLKEMEEKDGR